MSFREMSWSELPSDLLSDIAACLQRRSDILNFRSVCQTWRNSAPFSLFSGNTPILSPILPHKFTINLDDDFAKTGDSLFTERPLVLVATSVILIRSIVNPSFPPWLFSVEESVPGKLHLREFLSRSIYDKLPSNFPKHLSLHCFRVSELSRLYTLRCALDEEDEENIFRWKNCYIHQFNKVIFYVDNDKCENVDSSRIDDCALMVLFDDTTNGSLVKISLKHGKLSSIYCEGVNSFDDVECFKKRICAIDRKGQLYWEENGVFGRLMAVSEPVGDGLDSDRKKCLVVDPCGALYLVYRCPAHVGVAFKVYQLNEGKKKWEEVKGIGDDRILFATHDGCFFVSTRDIPTWRGNCLVFSRGVFPAYSRVRVADSEIFKDSGGTALDIAVFHFGSGECRPITNGCAEVLWPIPAWLSSDEHSSKWLGFQKDGELERDSLVRNCPGLSGIKTISCPPGFQGHTRAKEWLSSPDDRENLFVEGSTSNNTRCENAMTIIPKSLESGVSKTKFQGVDVRSDLVPTLKEIWAKHGNILGRHSVQSNDLVAWALESVAKVVILLDNTSGRSLNNSEADYLSSTLFDLRLMHLNVSWLVPSVAKAFNLHNAMASKAEMEGILNEIYKATTQVAEMKSKFLAEINGLEKMLDEQLVKVRESLSALDCLDRGNSLGK